MLLFKPDAEPPPGTHACKQDVPEMAKLVAELKAAGTLLTTTGLMGSDRGARVRMSGGRATVTDGPFTEAKELVAGVALVDVPTKADAVALCQKFLQIAGGGEGEVREVAPPAADNH